MFYNLALITIVILLVSAVVVTIKSFFETLEVDVSPDEEFPWWAKLVYLTVVLFAWYLYYLFFKWFILCLFTFQCS